MCSGKTTLGRALSCRINRPFVDLDEYIEQMAGMSVSEIFSRHGEAHFRELERTALRRLASDPACPVVACGGGTPCQPGNMELMNSLGMTILLECERDRLMRRLREGRDRRPLVAGMTDSELERYADESMRRRRDSYTRARARFDSTRLETEDEIRDTVNLFIATFLTDDQP